MTVDSVERRLEGYALLHHPAPALADRLMRDLGWQLVKRTPQAAEGLAFLSEFTFPATRHVLFAADAAWSVLLDNTPNADVDRVPFIAGTLRLHALRVVNSPERKLQKPGLPDFYFSYESRIVQYSDRDFAIQKMVYLCLEPGEKRALIIDDLDPGHTPVTAFVDPTRRRKRERFTMAQLEALVAALGSQVIRPDDVWAAQDFYLFSDPAARATPKGTPLERDNAGWHFFELGVYWSQPPRRQTNWYDSVITAMERAVAYDPTLARAAEEYLQPARLAKRQQERRPR